MSLFDDAQDALDARRTPATTPDATPEDWPVESATLQRAATVDVAGGQVTIEPPETTQTGDEGTWLSGANQYGVPRGADALENRQIVQTSAMQSIVNIVVDQLLGGDLAFEASDAIDEIDEESEVGRLRDLIEQVLTGPHMQDESLDDLITAAVEDMMGPGQAYWQLLEPESGDVPVVAMTSLDPLTIRHNVDKHGYPGDPQYWQAMGAFSGGQASSLGAVDPTPLSRDQLAVMNYPRGNRSYKYYPISPAWQVKEWLEILANSTTHHNRFYSDDEIPPGLLQIVNASENTVKDVRQKIEEASGDPRNAPIIGGEGGAQWIDMGGTAVNLAIVEEQRWFYFLCLGALGLGKSEMGFVEDTNRSNGEIEASRIYKRVTKPFIDQFEQAFKKVCRQFDAYRRMEEPFTPTIAFSDPREERAKAERLRAEYRDGVLTLNQVASRRGDEQLAEMDTTVEMAGEVIDYGDKPLWVAKRLMSAAAGEGVDVDTDEEEEDPDPDDGDDDGEAGAASLLP